MRAQRNTARDGFPQSFERENAMDLYTDKSSDPKWNAQRNLEGRTHYVDDGTLRFHKARILAARPICNGLLFMLIESVAMDPDNRKRGFRGVAFDLYGNTVTRSDLEDCASTRVKAEKEFWREVEKIDAKAVNLAALDRTRKYQSEELERDAERIVKAAQ